jgi:hypothetical protein
MLRHTAHPRALRGPELWRTVMFSVRFSDDSARKLRSSDVDNSLGGELSTARHKSVLTAAVSCWHEPSPSRFLTGSGYFVKEEKKTYSCMVAQEIPSFCETKVLYRLCLIPSQALLPKTVDSSPHSRYFKGPLQFPVLLLKSDKLSFWLRFIDQNFIFLYDFTYTFCMFCLPIALGLIIQIVEGEYELWSFWLLSLVVWEVSTNISEESTASVFRVKEKSHVIFSINLFLPLSSSPPQKTALGCTQVAVMIGLDWKTRSSCTL